MATLDSVLGPGLANPRKEVDAGDFSIDIVAETDVGDIVIRRRVRTRAPARRDEEHRLAHIAKPVRRSPAIHGRISPSQRWRKPSSTTTTWPVRIAATPYSGRGTSATQVPPTLDP